MPNLSKKINSVDTILNIAQSKVKESLMDDDSVVKFMGGDISVTPLLPIGNSLYFKMTFQILPRTEFEDLNEKRKRGRPKKEE